MVSYALTNQVLTLYLELLGNSQTQIGGFMTLTLVGDTIISYFLTWNADTIGRRRVILLGCILMTISGLVFTYYSNFYILLLASIFGVISPSGDETGPFKSVEEAVIAHLTPDNHRPEIFAFYGLFATCGAALGSLFAGVIIDHMNLKWKFDLETCYRTIFFIYSVFAFIKLLLSYFLSSKCEMDNEDILVGSSSGISSGGDILDSETTSLVANTSKLSSTTLRHLPRLLIVFMLDSLGYGFMPSAWIIYYLKKSFEVTATGLGLLFFATNFSNAASLLPSAYLAKSLGPVKAIIFTQVPSGIFFAIITIIKQYSVVVLLLVLYYLTSAVDVVPRQILLTTIIPKHEVTKVMGVVNIGKTFARCIGPIFTGKLASKGQLKFGFLINGVCLILADFILGINFLHLDEEIKNKQSINHSID